MFLIKNTQIEAIENLEKKKFAQQAIVFFKEKFSAEQLALMNKPVDKFVAEYMNEAYQLNIHAPAAVVKFILLNFIKGAGFIERPENSMFKQDIFYAKEENKEKLLDNFFKKT